MALEAASEAKTQFDRASVQEARMLLSDAARTMAQALVWNPNHETHLSTTFVQVNEREKTIRLALPSQPLSKSFSRAFEESAGRPFVFSVKIPKANFFFKTDYLGSSDSALHFSYPSKVFKVQRRKAKRFRVPADLFMKAEFHAPRPPHEKVSERVYDLSREGLSFIGNDIPIAVYQRGLRIEGLKLNLGRKRITANVMVLNARLLPSSFREKGVHVGVKFTEITAKDADMLGVFVDREIQKQLARSL